MTAVTRVYLVRHGETEWNQNTPGYCGWSDIPLNSKGIAQAEALGRRFEPELLSAVICSDLERAYFTAQQIADRTGCVVHKDARFREINYGDWEGKSPEQLETEDPDRFNEWRDNPDTVAPRGGETLQQVLDRAAPAAAEWIERHAGQSIAIVAHKTTVRLLLCWAMGLPALNYGRILQQNAAINLIEVRNGRPLVGLINDTCHLPEELVTPAV